MAQTVTNPGLSLPPVYIVTAPDIIDSGVTDAQPLIASAIVHDVPTGQLEQSLNASTPEVTTLSLTNNGMVAINASARAASATGPVAALAAVDDGIIQRNDSAGDGSPTASDKFINNGALNIGATSVATTAGDAASTSLVAAGVRQGVNSDGTEAASFVNSGTGTVNITSSANANATTAVGTGLADARARGVEHALAAIGGTASAFDNAGVFNVTSTATATGASGAGVTSQATGFEVRGEPVGLAVNNSKTFTVTANAVSDGLAQAEAFGMDFHASDIPLVDTLIPAADITNLISGTVNNSGTINVTASSLGPET